MDTVYTYGQWGDRYEGEWKNGKRDGIGTYIWKSGKRAKGRFKNNKMVSSQSLQTKHTVLDKYTGLMWERQGKLTPKIWRDSWYYCRDLTLGGYSDWRLPNIRELKSSYNIRIKFKRFDDTSGGAFYYWSSTTNKKYRNYAHGIYISGGNTFDDGHKDTLYRVRCVRGKRQVK